jgi:primary-amine oxidase
MIFRCNRRRTTAIGSTLLGLLASAGLLTRLPAIAPVFAPRTVAAESSRPEAARHPLDPLNEAEIALAAQRVREYRDFPQGSFFPIIALQEPPKEEVTAFVPGASFRREAFVVVLDRPRNRTFEAVVDLQGRRVQSWHEIPHVQPLVMMEEYERYSQIVKADPRWQEAMHKRGITEFDKVVVEGWAAGHLLPAGHEEARLMRGICYLKDGASNYYGRPIEGVIPTVDMNAGKLVELIDTGIVPVPKSTQQLDPGSIGAQRTDLKPLVISQPEGPSFQVRGNEVRWQKWRFRFALHPREGLVLYTVGYEDQGRLRSILYRASLSETVVPYGDPDRAWAWRDAFDEGEYGVGKFCVSVQQDAPPNAVFFDAAFADDLGKPYTAPKRVGLYERDGGVLWRHTDAEGRDQVRRARELVLFSVATIGNYDYLFHWIFKQDGSLEVDVGATGIMLPKGVRETDGSMSDDGGHHAGHLVAPGVVAPHHQHFFNFRLDFDVDGTKNSVAELNTEPVPAGPENPYQNAMRVDERVLRDEAEAQRDLNLQQSRRWKVFNPSLKTGLGYAPGFLLVPAENAVPYVLPGSNIRRRAGFINHAVWVTRYHPEERHAAGYYPNQSRGGEGLPVWAGNRESIRDQDLVVWYTMGLTHVPRPEEWPVMPVSHIGFKLLPAGFFDRNPGLDVPPPEPARSTR